MSLFKIFRRNMPSEQQPSIHSISGNNSVQAPAVDASLFVDEQQPDLFSSPNKQQENYMQIFLNQKFDWIGYNDGYSHPDTEFMENRLKLFRADFRLSIDKTMELRRAALGDLKIHAIRTVGIATNLSAQLNEKIKQLEGIIHELDMQKILSVENEGTIATAVHAYKLGFLRGVEKLQEENFFGQSTGLFN